MFQLLCPTLILDDCFVRFCSNDEVPNFLKYNRLVNDDYQYSEQMSIRMTIR